jgi:hypothetical protein
MTTPLWRVMHNAYDNSTKPEGAEDWENEHGYAAEIRAIADEIDERFKRLDYMTAEEITTWLRAEANRAEAGE